MIQVPDKQQKFPESSLMKGEQNNPDNSSISKFLSKVPSFPPLSYKNSNNSNNNRYHSGIVGYTYTCNINNSKKGGTGGTDNTPKPETNQVKDPRFNSQIFRDSVRLVLESLGLESTYGNFKRFDRNHGSETPIDWLVTARGITHPIKVAMCHVLDAQKEEVQKDGMFVSVGVEIAACSESDATENLRKRGFLFKRWLWD